jgi:hypothetical protein
LFTPSAGPGRPPPPAPTTPAASEAAHRAASWSGRATKRPASSPDAGGRYDAGRDR